MVVFRCHIYLEPFGIVFECYGMFLCILYCTIFAYFLGILPREMAMQDFLRATSIQLSFNLRIACLNSNASSDELCNRF